MKLIHTVAEELEISEEFLEYYGKYTAKLQLNLLDELQPRGKLILVTAVTPTSHGEGKTVMSIGLTQALVRLGKKALVTLREPSLGPVFGLKGGATGGGQSQVEPAQHINLHFNGDFHAVTAAHNLLAAMIDTHLHHGNALRFDVDEISWSRALDMNDRALRHVIIGLGGKANGLPRETSFVITAASEVMAILALARDRADLRRRLGNIVVGTNMEGKPVRAGDLRCTGALMVLLNEAIMPNLVQTTEGAPALVHTGPFANIAHGTSSVICQRMGLRLADYVVNETGFAADLGAEKYLDIVMPASGLTPDLAVLIASVRALAAQGAGTEGAPPTIADLRKGLCNLGKHLDILRRFGLPAVVAVNRFAADSNELIAEIEQYCVSRGVPCAAADVYAQGGEGGEELAGVVVDVLKHLSCRAGSQRPESLYPPEMGLVAKLETVAREVYGAEGVYVERQARRNLERFERNGFGGLPVCVAKTQSSLTDNPKTYGAPTGWTLTVSDAHLAAGAGYVVAIAGHMMRMPGLGRNPQALHLDVDDAGTILNLT